MAHLGKFLKAIWTHWVALMSGVVGLAMTIWSQETHQSGFTNLAFAAICVVGLFLAFFHAWRDQHVALLERAEKDDPKLQGHFQQILRHIVKLPDGRSFVGVMIVLEIRNLGADSIADAYRMTAKVGDRELNGDLQLVPPELPLEGATPGSNVVLYGRDALHQFETIPIARGAKRIGLVWGIFNELAVYRGDITFYVRFRDITGKEYVSSYRATGDAADEYRHAAGLTLPPPGQS